VELRLTLAGIEPPIWRYVRVPDAYTLHQLHRVIQLVFGWLDYHLYTFEVAGRRSPDDARREAWIGVGRPTHPVWGAAADGADSGTRGQSATPRR
jgi:hypothetical protein